MPVTSVAPSTSAVQALPAAGGRYVLTFYNGSTKEAFLARGDAMVSLSPANWTIRIAPGGFYEVPGPTMKERWTAVWAEAATGTLQADEERI